MTRLIVVGSGAGGATVAKELQGPCEVTILEAGPAFQRSSWELTTMEKLKRTRLLLDEREVRLFFPAMQIRKSPDMVLVSGRGVGGTTTISTGNGLRMDQDLQALGINLDAEFAEVYQEIPVTTAHQHTWHETTQRLFALCQDMELDPRPTPKMGLYERCVHCGRCVLGCPHSVKWDSRQFVAQAVAKGAQLITGCTVERVVVKNGRVSGVEARRGWTRAFYPADLVVLAAGGLATPLILQQSGLACAPALFVDPVLCVAAPWPDCQQYRDVAMPFIVQRDGFIISPYFDYLSFCFNRAWTHPGKDILSLMIKVADSNVGTIARGKIDKRLTAADKQRLSAGVRLCREILQRLGIDDQSTFLGTVNAGHPGGMLPLTEREADSFHHSTLPENLYVADATLFPQSLGNPPILTIIAMAKRVSKLCAHTFGLAAPVTLAS